jgi:phosphoribosylaminoimidazole-succinocarboxamide synthase
MPELLDTVLLTTKFPDLNLRASGKVRDVYDVGPDHLLFVATDRISAFDYVLATGIPGKGRVLTQMSLFWFEFLRDVVPNHVETANVSAYPAMLEKYSDQLQGRSMLVKRAEMFPVECVARGYLSGSGWKQYQASGSVCGIPLPAGLRDSDQLPEPIFTPATKAATGHDENISFDQAATLIGNSLAEKVRAITLEIYRRAAAYAEPRGILLADTKFEFGLLNKELIWIDEALTPDSSRFWPASAYKPGGPQPSFDKQFVRDYLERIQWPKTPPGPELPFDVVASTRAKYREAYRILVGRELD